MKKYFFYTAYINPFLIFNFPFFLLIKNQYSPIFQTIDREETKKFSALSKSNNLRQINKDPRFSVLHSRVQNAESIGL